MSRTLVVQPWYEYEYEPGWGSSQRLDGYSLHTSEEARKVYIETIKQKRLPPSDDGYDCFDIPADTPYLIDTTEEEYKEVFKLGGTKKVYSKTLPK